MTFSVLIGTYGDDCWRDLAGRAAASARGQTAPALEVIHIHGATLDSARNDAAARARGDWLIFLDADDELHEGYVEHMGRAVAGLPQDDDFLLQPATLGVHVDGREDPEPVLIPAKASIMDGNWLVIGTAIRREQFLRLGGFTPLPAWEDWHLMIRAILDGARPVQVPGAVYRVHLRPGSRNQLEPRAARSLFDQIRSEFSPAARRR